MWPKPLIEMKKILVVDDSSTVRQQVAAALSNRGFGIVEAADGLDAFEKLEPAIALIVNMPRLNGIETLEKLRADPQWATIPVVILTTEASRC